MRDDLNAACAAQPGLMAGIQALLLQHEVEQFYHREAALLDERRFEDWLELLADDLSYWMPVRETRAAGQEAGEFSRPGEGALFDETKALMIVRVRKLRTGFAWAEEPHSGPGTSSAMCVSLEGWAMADCASKAISCCTVHGSRACRISGSAAARMSCGRPPMGFRWRAGKSTWTTQ